MKKFLTPGDWTRPLAGGFRRTNGVAACNGRAVAEIVEPGADAMICGAGIAGICAISSVFMAPAAISLVSALMRLATGVDVNTSPPMAIGRSDEGAGLCMTIFIGSLLCLSSAWAGLGFSGFSWPVGSSFDRFSRGRPTLRGGPLSALALPSLCLRLRSGSCFRGFGVPAARFVR